MPKSVVMTVYNASRWLDDALQSILAQTFTGTLQVSVYNDGSTVSNTCTSSTTQPYMEIGYKGYFNGDHHSVCAKI